MYEFNTYQGNTYQGWIVYVKSLIEDEIVDLIHLWEKEKKY